MSVAPLSTSSLTAAAMYSPAAAPAAFASASSSSSSSASMYSSAVASGHTQDYYNAIEALAKLKILERGGGKAQGSNTPQKLDFLESRRAIEQKKIEELKNAMKVLSKALTARCARVKRLEEAAAAAVSAAAAAVSIEEQANSIVERIRETMGWQEEPGIPPLHISRLDLSNVYSSARELEEIRQAYARAASASSSSSSASASNSSVSAGASAGAPEAGIR